MNHSQAVESFNHTFDIMIAYLRYEALHPSFPSDEKDAPGINRAMDLLLSQREKLVEVFRGPLLFL